MKPPFAQPARLICFYLAAFVLLAWNCRAGLTLQLDLEGGSGTYVCSPNLSTNGIGPDQTPTTFHQVRSPNSQFIGDLPGNGDDLRNPLNGFDSFMQELTNGVWTLILNVGATNQQTYHFTVTNFNIISNSFVPVSVTFPLPGMTNAPPLPTYTWTGPSTWDGLFIDVFNNDASIFQYAFPSVTTTSDTLPPALPAENYTFVVDYNVNASSSIGSTTPTNSSGTPISGWVSTAQLDSSGSTGFTVVVTTNTSLVAHYTFDDSNNLGADSSGNGFDLDYNGGDGVVTSGFAKAGSAVYFDGNAYFTYTHAPAAVMNALAGDFTLSLWLSTTDTSGSTNDPAFFDAGIVAADIPGQANDIIPMALTGGGISFNTGPDDQNIHTTQEYFGQDGYHHLVATRKQSTGEKQIYIDGVLRADGFGSTNLLNDPVNVGIGTGIDASQTDPSQVSNGQFLNGFMDDIQLYSNVLTADQIQFLFSNPGQIIGTTNTGQNFNFALNTTNLAWTVSGDTAWFVETNVTFDGVSAAQSGIVTNDLTSVISTTITGPAQVTYYWKVTGNENMNLEFDVDGNYTNNIFGLQDWIQDGPYIIGSGSHTLSWTASTGGDTDTNEAAFLDEVSIIPITLPVITVNPINQTNRPGYPVGLLAAVDTSSLDVTWQWFKVGSGAISGAKTAFFSPTNSGTAGVAGQYYAVASNAAGSVTTTTNTVTFQSAPLPPDWTAAFKSPFFAQDNSQSNQDFYYNLATDPSGNLYVATEFGGNVTFNNTNISSGSGGDGAALVKESATGAPIWVAVITNNGTGNAATYCVVPNSDGGAFMAGDYSGSNFYNGTPLPVTGEGIFLGRFNPGGSNVWLKTFAITNGGFVTQNCVASDGAGNVSMAALFNGPIANVGGSNFTINGQQSIIFQFDPTGSLRWAQVCGSFVNCLTYSGGRLYAGLTTIANASSTNASIGTMTNSTDRAWAIAALNDATGQPIWISGLGARSGSQNGNPFYKFLADDAPRIAVAGRDVFVTAAAYDSSAMFGGITVMFDSLRGQYFARYDTNGNPQTAVAYGGTSTTPEYALVNSSGDVYVAGLFDDISLFGTNLIGASEQAFQYYGDFSDGFLAKFDRNGNAYWVRMVVAPSDGLGNLYGLALGTNGVWGSGYGSSGPANAVNNAVLFGTNHVFSDLQFLFGGPGGGTTFIGHPAGMIGFITDATSSQGASLTLTSKGLTGSNYSFTFTSTSGHTNMVQYSTNLAGHVWLPYTNIVGDGTLKTIVVPANTPAQEFFRVYTP